MFKSKTRLEDHSFNINDLDKVLSQIRNSIKGGKSSLITVQIKNHEIVVSAFQNKPTENRSSNRNATVLQPSNVEVGAEAAVSV